MPVCQRPIRNSHFGSINLYLKRADGSFVAMTFRVDPTQLTTGATLRIDGKQVDASLVFTDGVTIGGFLDRGQLNVYSAWTAPGGGCAGPSRPTRTFSRTETWRGFPSGLKPRGTMIRPAVPARSSGMPTPIWAMSSDIACQERRPTRQAGKGRGRIVGDLAMLAATRRPIDPPGFFGAPQASMFAPGGGGSATKAGRPSSGRKCPPCSRSICRISLPSRDHSAGRLALCPVYPQLLRCRGLAERGIVVSYRSSVHTLD